MSLPSKGYYVYGLVSSLCGLFYVGKGTGQRAKDHLRNPNSSGQKDQTISLTLMLGGTIDIRIFWKGNDEKQALMMEQNLISIYGRSCLDDLGCLTNITRRGGISTGNKEYWSLKENRERASEKTKLSMTPERRLALSQQARKRSLTMVPGSYKKFQANGSLAALKVNSKMTIVEGVEYPSLREAADTIGTSVDRVKDYLENRRTYDELFVSRTGRRKERTPPNLQKCTECGLVGRGGTMKRFHFENCKHAKS